MIPEPRTPDPDSHAPPDWQSLSLDVTCPRCAYNLRGLATPRCPECGLDFQWSDVVAAARQRIDCDLFEAQWRKRPVRSFCQTCLAALNPWKFWRSVPIHVTPRSGGLCLFSVALTLLTAFLVVMTCRARVVYWNWRRPINAQYGWSASWIWWEVQFSFQVVLPFLLLALLAFFVTLLFWQTRRKLRVRPSLVLRIAVYSLVPLAAAQAGGYFLWEFVTEVVRPRVAGVSMHRLLQFRATGALALYFLWYGLGLRDHLGIDRPWRLVAAIIVILLAILFLTIIYASFFYGWFLNPVTEFLETIMPSAWRLLSRP